MVDLWLGGRGISPKYSSASSTVLPFKASVIRDAEAVEMAQPAPWNVIVRHAARVL